MLKLPKLPTLKPRERLFALGSSVVLVIVILDRLVLAPWSRHAAVVHAEIRKMEMSLAAHQHLLLRKGGVMADLQRQQRYLRDPIADDLEMAALLKEVEGLAAQSQVKVSEIKPLATETVESTKRYSLEVRFQCTLDGWAEFVYRIEQSPSLYGVARAGLSTKEEMPDVLDAYLRLTNATMVPDAEQEELSPDAIRSKS